MKKITFLIGCFFLTTTVFGQISESKKEKDNQHATMEQKKKSPIDENTMMEKWKELIALGEEHKNLQKEAGTYNYTNTMWTHPGAEPMKSQGTTIIEPVMDGRYMIEKHEGETMGMPFYGMAIVGYDKVEKAYVSTWIDNMGTGILKFTGNYNDSGALVSKTYSINPMTREKEKHTIMTKPSENGWEMNYYILYESEEKPFHTMHVVYTKAHK